MTDDEWGIFAEQYKSIRHELEIFMDGVEKFFSHHPELHGAEGEKLHSLKKRLKSPDHLREKIDRKRREGRLISPKTMFSDLTDLAGVRLLLLFQGDFSDIDRLVRGKVQSNDWHLHERPKAFTWDPETTEFFEMFDVDVQTRDTSYTSVHYVVRPREDSPLSCEIQVRTLFEEIWGEVDHRLNYPKPTDSVPCREQLRVLSKIAGAGSRLLDSIQRSISSQG